MIEDDYKKTLKEEERDYEKFNKLMRVPLMDLSDEDLDWAYRQDRFNSINSKGFFYQEIMRRKEES